VIWLYVNKFKLQLLRCCVNIGSDGIREQIEFFWLSWRATKKLLAGRYLPTPGLEHHQHAKPFSTGQKLNWERRQRTLKRARIGVNFCCNSEEHNSYASNSNGNFTSFKILALIDSFSL
jgi:hypothetical protein